MGAVTENEASRGKVIATVAFYMISAIVITVNKWVLIDTPTPILFIAMQCLIGTLLILLVAQLGIIKLSTPLDMATANKLWPIMLVGTASLAFGNLTLLFVDASFYQVARGLMLPITVVLAFVLQSSPPSRWALIGCGCVTVGFFVGSISNAIHGKALEKGVTLIGVLFGVAGSFLSAIHAVLIKTSLPHCNGSAMDLAFYGNFSSFLFLVPLAIAMGELPALKRLVMGEEGNLMTTITGTIITGAFGFMIGIAGLLSVKVTSPVTHMTSSAARGVLQTLIGIWFLGDVMTKSRICSVLIIIIGSCQYTYVKHIEQEMREAAAKISYINQASEAENGDAEYYKLMEECGEEIDEPEYRQVQHAKQASFGTR